MKKNALDTKRKNSGFGLFKKYNYNIDEVIGVKGKEKYILYVDKKLIRIYRGNLASSPLLCSYVPVESAIFFSFLLEKSVLEKIDLDSYIETKVYEEAGVEETEEYIIKYKLVDKYQDPKYVVVETVIVPTNLINTHYKEVLEQTGYIDYLSFPAFAYKALYAEEILKKANDVFVVLLFDKIFLTFYSEGELVYIATLSSGLDKVYEALQSLQIKNFDIELFKKLLLKKGLNLDKYASNELAVLEIIKKEFANINKLIHEQLTKITSEYEVGGFDRLFITSEYGEILGVNEYFKEHSDLEVYNFEFYEKYNLDRLPIDPFLFLGMLETHYAYKYEDQTYNFSPFLREPTFFYRPSGKLFLITAGLILVMGAWPMYEFLKGWNYERKNNILQSEINKLQSNVNTLQAKVESLTNKEKSIKTEINRYEKDIAELKKFIEEVYKFKFSYMPKSQEIVDLTYYLDKFHVYLKDMSFANGEYVLHVYAYNNSNIPDMINELTQNGYDVYAKEVVLKDGKYKSEIRIKE
ncbi:hypothetical protein [Caminibacter pacificus]